MASQVISLQVGSTVQYQGEDWTIILVHDFSKVLALRIKDGYPEFIPLEAIELPGRLDDSPEGEIAPPTLPDTPQDTENLRKLARRTIRPLGNSPKDHAKIQALVQQHQAIFPILRLPKRQRRDAIELFAKQFSISVPTAYRRIAIAEMHGTADALQRSVRSDKGKQRLPEEVVAIVREHIKKHRAKATAKSLERVTILINGTLKKQGLRTVSIESVRRIEQEKPLKERLKEQGRITEVKNLYAEKVGHLPGNDYPLAIVQIDHTTCQIIFVDEEYRLPIGDAWLSLVIDTYSRMVLGFFLSFDHPSNLSVGVALAQAILPKERHLQRAGVEGEWPCWGFPDIVHVDNGADLNSHMMHGARKEFMFDITDRPVGSPELGSTVESAFRTFIRRNKEIHGTKFSNIYEHVDYDSEGHATMTLREFETLFTEFLVNDYHLRGHRGHDMDEVSPLVKWKRGIFEGDKRPPRGLPDRPTDEQWITLNLLPFKMRTVQKGTVELFNGHYHSGALQQVMLDIDPRTAKGNREFMVRYDPRDISKVWLFRPKTQSYIALNRTDGLPPISLWEYKTRRRRRGSSASEFEQRRHDSIVRQDELQAASAKKTKQARKSRQREVERQRGSITTPSPSPKTIQPTNDVIDMPTDEQRRKLMERIRVSGKLGTKGGKHDD